MRSAATVPAPSRVRALFVGAAVLKLGTGVTDHLQSSG
jgi:hypothetical protein